MGKRRSVGLILFSLSLIAACTINLLAIGGILINQFLPKAVLLLLAAASVIWSILGVVCAIAALMLKEWARRVIIILMISAMAMSCIFIVTNHMVPQKMPIDTIAIEQQYDNMPPEQKEKLKVTKEQYVSIAKSVVAGTYHVVIGIIEGMIMLYMFLVLLFFTRPKVREQFRQ